MMVWHIEQFAEHTIGPAIGCQLAAAWVEAGLARVRHDFDLVTIGTLMDVSAECRPAAHDDLADRLEHHRTDPSTVAGYEPVPVHQQDRRRLETDLLGGRLGYHQKNTAGAVFALHAKVERVLDSLIRSLNAKISAKS